MIRLASGTCIIEQRAGLWMNITAQRDCQHLRIKRGRTVSCIQNSPVEKFLSNVNPGAELIMTTGYKRTSRSAK